MDAHHLHRQHPSGPLPSRVNMAASDKTYINVRPTAIASKHGRVIHNPSSAQWPQQPLSSSSSSSPDVGSAKKVPIIPQSQEVKQFIKEPSYSTLLQLERDAAQRLQQHIVAAAAAASRRHEPTYANCSTYNYSEFDEEEHHPQHYTSPPSPVSSSYSELRQATKYPPGYHFQQMAVATVPPSNYESLYESVHPGSTYGGVNQELLYRAMSSNSSESSDYFGMCSKCQGKIVGEGTGCSAMGRLYHIQCFTCYHCQGRLQGKPFYALDGQPFCQADYLDTLEKCCKCTSPILERILRATGKPYHPQCFTCIVCSQSLDGVPFTVDATNQIHCIPCFHRRFAPKCSVCRQPIMPEPGQEETVRVVALDRSFHVNCYRCEDCAHLLSSEEEGGSGCYPLDGHALCKRCSTTRIQDLTNGMDSALQL